MIRFASESIILHTTVDNGVHGYQGNDRSRCSDMTHYIKNIQTFSRIFLSENIHQDVDEIHETKNFRLDVVKTIEMNLWTADLTTGR